MIRAFIAIPLEKKTKEKVSNIIETLAPLSNNIKWAKDAQMHITVKFLGNIDDDTINRTKLAMDTLKELPVFKMELFGIGGFPSISNPRVLWIGITRPGHFNSILEQLAFHLHDINYEKRAFAAHLTIGRVNGIIDKQVLAKAKELCDSKTIAYSIVDRVILFRSTLKPTGAIHTQLYAVNLNKEAL
ncbi:MAG: RNA 2',3'-cyclic phosphodiesterase [Deltaproteobacteria bacterium]|nr:RNA 2',3'-cyclic phosphodiesterase [Deltaproteobacteria bacterium]MCL5792538.1 RNA 2',3'-cyclic phosphodiesterase [Deltaproteobacteria bacterium]